MVDLDEHASFYRSRYSRMDQVKFFKGCLSQVLLGPFLNTLTHVGVVNPLNASVALI